MQNRSANGKIEMTFSTPIKNYLNVIPYEPHQSSALAVQLGHQLDMLYSYGCMRSRQPRHQPIDLSAVLRYHIGTKTGTKAI